MKLRCISLHQPYASAVALGLKKIETRNRPTFVTGLIGIHAAKLSNQSLRDRFYQFCGVPLVGNAFKVAGMQDFDNLPFGKIVAVAELVESVNTEMVRRNLSVPEFLFGDYDNGRHAWILKEIRPIARPIPAKGKRGFFFVVVKPHQLEAA